MKRLLGSLMLMCGLPLLAADSTIGNLTPITVVPDAYRMPWENPGVVDYYITFANLTNQVLTGYASQTFASAAAAAATNDLSGVLEAYTDAATNALSGVLEGYADDATNALSGVLTGYTDDATNALSGVLESYADAAALAATNDLSGVLEGYTDAATNALSGVLEGYTDAATNALSGVLKGYTDAATNALSGVLRAYSDGYTDDATNALSGVLTGYTDDATNALSGVLEAYTDAATNALSGVLESYADGAALAATNDLSGVLTGYTDDATNALSGVLEGYTDAATNALSGVLKAYTDAATNDLSSVVALTYLPLAGGTVTGPVLTTSSSSNSPATLELATAGWIRSLFEGAGVSYYATTNLAVTFTNADYALATNWSFSTDLQQYATRVKTTPTAGDYIGSITVTNKLLQINAGIVVNAYLSSADGGGVGGPSVKPEIYISYDKTNWFGDWDAQPQYIPEGSTNVYSWVMPNPTYVTTNATGFYVQRRFKVVTQPAPPSSITFHMGTNYPSHIALSGASESTGNAYLNVNQSWTASNNFVGPLTQNGVAVLTNAASVLSTASFAPYDLSGYGTNVLITPANGNLQYYTITGACYFGVASVNTNYTEAVRLELRGSNYLSWTNLVLSNSVNLGPSNDTSVILLDRASGTNLWWGYRLR